MQTLKQLAALTPTRLSLHTQNSAEQETFGAAEQGKQGHQNLQHLGQWQGWQCWPQMQVDSWPCAEQEG